MLRAEAGCEGGVEPPQPKRGLYRPLGSPMPSSPLAEEVGVEPTRMLAHPNGFRDRGRRHLSAGSSMTVLLCCVARRVRGSNARGLAPDDGLASRCLTTRPTLPVLRCRTGTRTPNLLIQSQACCQLHHPAQGRRTKRGRPFGGDPRGGPATRPVNALRGCPAAAGTRGALIRLDTNGVHVSRSFLGLCGAMCPLCRTAGRGDKPFFAGVPECCGKQDGRADHRPVRAAGRGCRTTGSPTTGLETATRRRKPAGPPTEASFPCGSLRSLQALKERFGIIRTGAPGEELRHRAVLDDQQVRVVILVESKLPDRDHAKAVPLPQEHSDE